MEPRSLFVILSLNVILNIAKDFNGTKSMSVEEVLKEHDIIKTMF